MSPESELVVVTFNVPPALEEVVIDWMLGQVGSAGFTGYSVYGHSASHSDLSAAEQVSGKRRRIQFDVELERSDAAGFLKGANEAFGAADVYCLVLPVVAAGSLDHVAQDFSS